MEALTGFVLRRRRLIGVFWLLAFMIGGYASSVLSSHLSMSFDIPGTHSDIAYAAIIAKYRSGGHEPPPVPVVRLPAGMSATQAGTRAVLLGRRAAASRLRH